MNSFSIIYKTLFLCSFLFLTTLSAQYIQITKPTAAQVIPNKSNLLEIAWITSIKTGHVRIEYSIDNKNYIEVSKEGINESPFNWFIPENIGTNKHGDLYIRVIVSEKKIIKDEVNIVVPELASTGSMVFETQLDDVFINIKNKKTLKPGEILKDLEPGEYYYTAKKQKYGQKKGQVVIKAGKIEKIKLNIPKTWGSVTFTSDTGNFKILIQKLPNYEQKEVQFISKEKKVPLERGKYLFTAIKKDFVSDTGEFTINPQKPKTIPIHLRPEFAKAKFQIYSKLKDIRIHESDVEIWCNGMIKGKTGEIVKIPEGRQLITAKKDGFRDTKKEYTFDPLKILNEINIEMVPVHGVMNITSDPPGATITLDNKKLEKKTPAEIDTIKLGMHTVSVSLDGFRPVSEWKEVKDNELTEFEFSLTEKQGSLCIVRRDREQQLNVKIDGKKQDLFFSILLDEKKFKEMIESYPILLMEGEHKIHISEQKYVLIDTTIFIPDKKTITLFIEEFKTLSNHQDSLYDQYIKQGDDYFENQEWNKSIISYEEALTIKPGNSYLREKIERIKDEIKFEEHLQKGEQMYRSNGSWEDIIAEYQKALRLKPGDLIAEENINGIKIEAVDDFIKLGDEHYKKEHFISSLKSYKKAKRYCTDSRKTQVIDDKINDTEVKLEKKRKKREKKEKKQEIRKQVFSEAEYDFLNNIGNYEGSCFFGNREFSVNYLNELDGLAVKIPGLIKTYALNRPAGELKKHNHAFAFGFNIFDNIMLSEHFFYFEFFNILLDAVFWSKNFNNKLFINISGNMPPLSGYMWFSDRSFIGKKITPHSTGSNSSIDFPLKTTITYEKYIGRGRSFQITAGKLWTFNEYNWYYRSDIEKSEEDDQFELVPVNYSLDLSKGLTFVGVGIRFSGEPRYGITP